MVRCKLALCAAVGLGLHSNEEKDEIGDGAERMEGTSFASYVAALAGNYSNTYDARVMYNPVLEMFVPQAVNPAPFPSRVSHRLVHLFLHSFRLPDSHVYH